MRLVLIGGGQMGRALVGGMAAAEALCMDDVCVVDRNPESRKWWQSRHPAARVTTDMAGGVADAEAVLIAVKPYAVDAVARSNAELWTGKLVISVAAGLPLADLCDGFGHDRIVRVMPNTPSLVGHGACGFCCADGVSSQDRETVETLLASTGVAVAVTESQMDAVTGVSGSGPAYIYMIIEAMADGGVKEGLPRALAMKLATQTVLGTAAMVAETGKHPGELKDAVASPGGTTIAAIASLEASGVRNAMINAVSAAAARSRELR